MMLPNVLKTASDTLSRATWPDVEKSFLGTWNDLVPRQSDQPGVYRTGTRATVETLALPAELQLLVERVEEAVRSRTSGQVRNLRIATTPGAVIVEGRVPTYYLKQLASHAACEVAGDLTIQNQVEVV